MISRRLYWLIILVLLVATGCGGGAPVAVYSSSPTLRPAAPVPTEAIIGSGAPPVGEIWFGTAFDITTYAVEGKTTKASLRAETAIVAHFDRIVDQTMSFQVLASGKAVYKEIIPLTTETDLYGVLLTLDTLGISRGEYVMRFRDAGGHTLAKGTIKLTK